MSKEKLTDDIIREKLSSLDGWEFVDGKLHRDFVFSNFVEAFRFMAGAALVAESMNHHPEWFNVYKKVNVDLTTHEAGGITQLDFDLAAKMNQLASS